MNLTDNQKESLLGLFKAVNTLRVETENSEEFAEYVENMDIFLKALDLEEILSIVADHMMPSF